MDTIIKKSPKITDYDSFSKTPYLIELQSKYYVPDVEHKAFTGEDGKNYGMYEIPKGKTILHDPRVYTKLFHGHASILIDLSESATRMFYYICEHLSPGKDEICILKEDYFAFAGYPKNNKLTYYRAVEGLLKASVIARKTGNPSCFFVNPDVIFNGDRTKLKNVIVKPANNRSINLGNKSM